MLLVGGEDATAPRTAPSGASTVVPVVGAAGKSPSGEVPSPPPQKTEEAATPAEGRPPAPDALVCPDLGSSAVEASIALPPPPPPP
jgi:hypothetical protein